MLDLNDLAIFVQIVDAGSFAGAARRIGAPANTLSRRVKRLEETIGARLMHRSTRKLTLTDAGKSLYEQSASQINELMGVSLQLMDGSLEPAGKVRVAVPADFFEVFQMDFVADFLGRYPKVQLDFVLGDQRNDLIAEGIDIAFRSGAMPDSNLVARKISTGRRVLAASAKYLEINGTPLDIHALNRHTFISFPHPSGQPFWDLIGTLGPVRLDILSRVCANTARVQMKAAIAGLGICFLPESIIRSTLKAKQLIEVLSDYDQPNNDLSIVYPSRRHIPLAVSIFVEESVKHLLGQLMADEPAP